MKIRTILNGGLTVAALSLAPLVAQAAPASEAKAPAATQPATTEAQNKALVREWFRLYEVKEIAAHNAMVHPDAVAIYPEMQYRDPEAKMGADGLRKTLDSDEATFADLRMRIDNMWAIGDTVFVEGYFIGSKLNGALARMAKAQKSYVPYLHRIEVKDGKIKLVHSYYDTALFYQIQLGLEGPTMEKPITPWMMALGAEAAARKAAKQ